jgi:alpha-tubulin suppressor-like RCC1 family protein
MKQKKTNVFLVAILLVLSTFVSYAQCPSGTYYGLNAQYATSPACIDYDNMSAGYHSVIVKESNGVFKAWGQNMSSTGASHLLSPTIINSTNFPGLGGTVLKATMGTWRTAGQNFVLTTDGLYAWGAGTNTVLPTAIKSTTAFEKITINGKSDGLPTGVSPSDVKTLQASKQSIILLTNAGDVYVISADVAVRGIGTTTTSPLFGGNANTWYRVQQDATTYLTNVIQVRIALFTAFALKSDGSIWTWGTATSIGNGNGANNGYATSMIRPTDEPIRMIGLNGRKLGSTGSQQYTYFLITNTNKLYALGDGVNRQLGSFTSNSVGGWTRPVINNTTIPATTFDNVAWISPSDNDPYYGNVNVITTDGKLYTWGFNAEGNLGLPYVIGGTTYDPTQPTGMATETIKAVETGSNISYIVKAGFNGYCFAGENINGALGNGNNTTSPPQIDVYTCVSGGATIQGTSCNAGTAPTLSSTTISNICPVATVNLRSLVSSSTPSGTELRFYTSSGSPLPADSISNSNAYAAAGTVYAYYYDVANNCLSIASSPITVTITSCVAGTVVCSKTKIYTAPVAGAAAQHSLIVTVNVTAVGCFPVTVSGSGVSLATSPFSVCATTTGEQQFTIPINYDGSALSTLNFTIGNAGSCTADLTKTPKKAIADTWTLDCVPTAGPGLK